MNSRKTHVLVECPELIPSVRVGVLDPLQPMNGTLYNVQFVKTIEIQKEHLIWADILITVRGSCKVSLRIVREAKRLGRLIVYYLDDDLLNLPRDSEDYKYFAASNQEKFMREILLLSDVLWGVNAKIKEKYLPLCSADRWIQNRVPMKVSVSPRTDVGKGPVNILYAGSTGHKKMVQEILVPAVRQICKKRGNEVRFTFMGVNPDLNNCPQVTYQPYFSDYDEYHRYVKEGNFAIGLAAVRTDEFYQCKYYNKFVEYSGIGAAGIYTDCHLYRQVIENGRNGLLCENTTKGWTEAIERLVDDTDLRRNCINEAQALLRREFQPLDVCQNMIEQLPELSQYHAPMRKASEVRLPSVFLSHLSETIAYLFRKYSVFAVFVIPFKAIRRLFKLMRKGLIDDVA